MKSFAIVAALVASVSAQGIAKVVNRCSYPVYLWSIDKQLGCSEETGTKLTTGQTWTEPLKNGTGTDNNGIAIKISKFTTCGGKDISQLEYYLDYTDSYRGNYLDMSFVDCTENLEDCPGRTDGFYLKSGDQKKAEFTSSSNNQHCPVFNVYNAEEAAKVSYINWDDEQTKFCAESQDLELYLCGGDAPDADDETEPVSSAAPKPSSSSETESTPSPTSKPSKSSKAEPAPTSTATEEEEEFVVAAAAAVTPAPEVPEVPTNLIVKTEVIYVTEYVNKRHAHGRRHRNFHA